MPNTTKYRFFSFLCFDPDLWINIACFGTLINTVGVIMCAFSCSGGESALSLGFGILIYNAAYAKANFQ
jgi:hypothetical protein